MTTTAILHPLKFLKGQKPGAHHIRSDKVSLFNGLHRESIFGIGRIVTRLVEVECCDINRKDSMANTPLAWAARNGHEAVVEILLGKNDIDPNRPGESGQTPLFLAAYRGHARIVKVLLGPDHIEPDKPDEDEYTPLFLAARDGREGVVKILLGRDDVNPNKSD